MSRSLPLVAVLALLAPSCVSPEGSQAARRGIGVLDDLAQVYGKIKNAGQTPVAQQPTPTPAPVQTAPAQPVIILPAIPGWPTR